MLINLFDGTNLGGDTIDGGTLNELEDEGGILKVVLSIWTKSNDSIKRSGNTRG
jgi:hypothetical protein